MNIMKILWFLFLLAYLFTGIVHAVDITISNMQDAPGKSFELPVYVSDLTGSGVTSYEFTLTYNPSILTATGARISQTLSSIWSVPTYQKAIAEIQVQAEGSVALSGAGRLIYLQFEVNPSAQIDSTSHLNFSQFKFNDDSIPVNTDSATFRVIQDVTPPVITSGPGYSSVTSHSVIIQWATDEAANSIVEYGLNTNYGSTKIDSAFKTDHRILLNALLPATTYHLKVKSTDPLGNGPTESQDMTFKTKEIFVSLGSYEKDPGAEIMIPVMISDITNQNVRSIIFEIEYAHNLLNAVSISTDGTLISSWQPPIFTVSRGRINIRLNGTIPLNGSGPIVKIMFQVSSDAPMGSSTTLKFKNVSFENGAINVTPQDGYLIVKDTQAPQITNGPNIKRLSSSSAVIFWETNEAGTSVIEYGESSEYGMLKKNAIRSLTHWLTITELKPSTTYHFRVGSADSCGNGPDYTEDQQFKTPQEEDIIIEVDKVNGHVGSIVNVPLRVNQIKQTDNVTALNGVLRFDPDILTLTKVSLDGAILGADDNLQYDTAAGQLAVAIIGTQPISGGGSLLNLEFQISETAVGNTLTAIEIQNMILNDGWPFVSTRNGGIQLQGNPDTKKPVITFGPIVDEITSNSAKIFWVTDEPANSSVVYGQDSNYGLSVEKKVLVQQHELKLMNLSSNTTYHLRVSSTDGFGNGPQWSSDVTFTTHGGQQVHVSLSDGSYPAGSLFTLPITIGNLNGQSIFSAQMTIAYDSKLLMALSASTDGTIAAHWGTPYTSIGNGQIDITMSANQSLSGSGILVKLKFQVKSDANANDISPIYFKKCNLNDDTPSAVCRHCLFQVKDTIAPQIISGPKIVMVTKSFATVLWATDEKATSIVEYGHDSNYGYILEDTQLKEGHAFILTDLNQNMTVHFRVGSFDIVGNGPSYSQESTFQTLSMDPITLAVPDLAHDVKTAFDAPITLSGVGGNRIFSVDFTLEFDPKFLRPNSVFKTGTLTQIWEEPDVQMTDSSVSIGLNGNTPITEDGDLIVIKFTSASEQSYGEQTPLILADATINHSTGGLITRNGSFTFTDNRAPSIISGPYTSEIRSKSAKIIWETDEPSNSRVEYGISTHYGDQAQDDTYVTYHEIELKDLYRSYSYHFRVSSTDKAGNGPTSSEDATFQTTGGNEILVSLPDTTLAMGRSYLIPVKIEDLTHKFVSNIKFHFSFDSDYLIPEAITQNGTLTNDWNLSIDQLNSKKLTGTLSSNTDLQSAGILFNIQVSTLSGAPHRSLHSIFIQELKLNEGQYPAALRHGKAILIDQSPPEIIEGPNVSLQNLNSVIISWTTDEPAYGEIEYGFDTRYGLAIQQQQLSGEHSILVTGLDASATYHYRVISTDSLGNGPKRSPDDTFTMVGKNVGVEIPALSFAPGAQFDLPVTVSTLTGSDIISYEFRLRYNQNILIPLGIKTDSTIASAWTTPSYSVGDNQILVTHSGSHALEGDGILVWLRFQVNGGALPSDTTHINFVDFKFNSGSPAVETRGDVFTVASGSGQGEILITLPDQTLIPGGVSTYPILVSNVTHKGIFAYQFELTYNPAFLQCKAILPEGSLSSNWEQFNIQLLTGKVIVEASGESALSDSGTLIKAFFHIRSDISPENSTIIKMKRFIFNSGFPTVQLKDGTIQFSIQSDAILGYVLSEDGVTAIGGATIQLDNENTGQALFARSDVQGYFEFSGLNSAHTFSLLVTKSGYSSSGRVTNLRSGKGALRLYLAKMIGTIGGQIMNPKSLPVKSALVTVDDGTGGGAGHFGTSYSDSSGYFLVQNLSRLAPFFITVEKSGYKRTVVMNVYADSVLNIVLDPYYSTLRGRIRAMNDSTMSGAQILVTDFAHGVLTNSTVSGQDGLYRMDDIIVGTYNVSVFSPGYLSIPRSVTLMVEPDTSYKLNFSMEEVHLADLEVVGPTFITNTDTSKFSYRALTDSSETMILPMPPEWTVDPNCAGSIQNGILQPDSTFMGEAQIIVRDRSTEIGDTLNLMLYAPITSQKKITLFDGTGFSLEISEASVASESKVYVRKAQNESVKRNLETSLSLFRYAYELQETSIQLLQPLRLTLPVPEVRDINLVRMAEWEPNLSTWIELPDAIFNGIDGLEVMITRFAIYGVLVPSEELGIHAIRFIPNPFSPNIDTDGDGEAGLAIKFYITSKATQNPFVTIKIYNLLGDLVKKLVDHKPCEKDLTITIHWDGLTDLQLKARNGRYMIHFIAEDPNGKKEYLKSIILIK